MTYQEMLVQLYELRFQYTNRDNLRISTYANIMHSFNLLGIEKCPEYVAASDIKLTAYKYAELVESESFDAS